MKKLLFITLILIVTSTITHAQKLKSTTDEFTGESIKETSWDRLIFDYKANIVGNSKIMNKEGRFALFLAMHGQTFGVNEGGELIFKFDDGSTLTILSIKLTLPTIGGGAINIHGSSGLGVTPIYSLSKEDLEILSKKKVTKVRVYTIDSYIDLNVKSKNSKKFVKQAQLILYQIR